MNYHDSVKYQVIGSASLTGSYCLGASIVYKCVDTTKTETPFNVTGENNLYMVFIIAIQFTLLQKAA